MATTSEQLILKAISEYCVGSRKTFRNRHIAALTGLGKQNINHYLNKWAKGGFVGKNPLASGEWILLDLNGLVADLIEPTEPSRMGHAKHELFDKEVISKLHALTELHAALKILKAVPPNLKSSLEEYINNAINELRNERTFMHVKQYSPNRARQTVRKHEALAESFGINVNEIAPYEKGLRLVTEEPEEEETEELSQTQKRISDIEDRLRILKMVDQEGNPEWERLVSEKNQLIESDGTG